MSAVSERRVSVERQMGAYYTPNAAADYMASWVVTDHNQKILEPSFGDGSFLRALSEISSQNALRGISFLGVELDDRAVSRARADGLLSRGQVVVADFLEQEPRPVDGVLGNPPYVRLRHILDNKSRDKALEVVEKHIPGGMEPSGSIWMPFVVHATDFLRPGGRMALVLPNEMTHVRYARPIWKFLGKNFGSLRLVRVYERIFPQILQDVVLLFADNRGSIASHIAYETFDSVSDLVSGAPATSSEIQIDRLSEGHRDFTAALLPEELSALLLRLEDRLVPLGSQMRCNVGYVSGDKEFFHPDTLQAESYDLPSASLIPALTSTRSLRGAGLYTSDVSASKMLFRPAATPLSSGERAYIRYGELGGVAERYKCRVRAPWYVVPGVLRPDVILSVFSSSPLLLINDANLVASNSLLCGYITAAGLTPEALSASWYSSLTLLQCELKVHSLGGGVLVMIPGEASKIDIPNAVSSTSHLPLIEERLRLGDVRGAYEAGDEAILRGVLDLTDMEIELVRHGVKVLARWRESERA